MNLRQRFARVATRAVVRYPRLWRLFRRPMRAMFDGLSPVWDEIRSAGHLASYEAALAAVEAAPRRALDLGTGTGDGAVAIARRWPDAEVVGLDLSGRMVEAARRKLPGGLESRVRFEVGDAARLPYPDGSFDLVGLANMIPFFAELARVVAPGGWAVFGFSLGPETPIYVPPQELREALARHGFDEFRELAAGPGTALLARRGEGR